MKDFARERGERVIGERCADIGDSDLAGLGDARDRPPQDVERPDRQADQRVVPEGLHAMRARAEAFDLTADTDDLVVRDVRDPRQPVVVRERVGSQHTGQPAAPL